MSKKEFFTEIKGIKSRNDLDIYIRTHLPACRIGTDVWESDGKVLIDGEENANDCAEIFEDIAGGIAFIRPYMDDAYGRWFSVTI